MVAVPSLGIEGTVTDQWLLICENFFPETHILYQLSRKPMTDNPKPPTTLSKKSAAYFKKFIAEYEVDDSHIEVLIRILFSKDVPEIVTRGLVYHC
jgi:hypothetical protein